VASAASPLLSIAATAPVPATPPGARTVSATRAIGTSSTFGSPTRTACTAKPSGNVHPVSSYGCCCGSLGLQYW
jgi:hypothetical protein